jgi:hypothetical protein
MGCKLAALKNRAQLTVWLTRPSPIASHYDVSPPFQVALETVFRTRPLLPGNNGHRWPKD